MGSVGTVFTDSVTSFLMTLDLAHLVEFGEPVGHLSKLVLLGSSSEGCDRAARNTATYR